MGKQSREKRLRKEEQSVEAIKNGGEKYEFQTGLEKTCLFIIRWGIYAALFVPLIVMTQFFFPFVAPKSTIFRILVEVIFAAYLVLAIHKPNYRLKINALTISLTVFLGVFILASLLGINFNRSFWSTYERMTGVFTMLHLYAFFVILTSCFKKRNDWEKFLVVSALAGVFLSIYILKGNQISTRGGGTIGNTSFMAAYLLFDVFFALILFLPNFLKKKRWPVFLQVFSGFSLLIMLPVLFKSSARGVIAFFEMGLPLIALGYLLFSGRKILKRVGLAVILISLLFGIIIFISPPELVNTKINSLFLEMKPRFAVWESGYNAWREKPLLGWGPENFNVAFLKYFNPCMFISQECGGEIWFDRVHNIVLDTLATTGLIGFLSYLAIFGIAIFSLIKTIPKIAEKRDILIPLGLSVLLLVYFAQNFLVFDMINTYLMFFLSLSFVVFLVREKEDEKIVNAKKINVIFTVPIILMTIVFLWWGNIKPLIAGQDIIKMISAQDIGQSAEYFQESLNSPMNKYEAREQFAQFLTGAAFRSLSQTLSATEKENLLKVLALAEKEMEKSAKENSLDFRPYLFLGKLYSASYQASQDQEKLKSTLYYLEKAITLSPNNQQGYWYLGEIELSHGKTEEAIALFQKAVDLEPRFLRAHWYLALAYKFSNNYQLAKEKLLELKKIGYDWDNNFYELKQAIDILQYFKDDAELLPFYQKVVRLQPDDIQMRFALATTYANLGQFNEAKEVAEKIKEMKPEVAANVDKFIESLSQ